MPRSKTPAAHVALAALPLLLGCGTAAGPGDAPGPGREGEGILPTGLGAEVDRGIERARVATARFTDPDELASAGYPAHVGRCLDNPPEGAMGFHHQNAALLDTILDVERPEILVYGRTTRGERTLNGVEYVVPLSEWSRGEPPEILGQKLKIAPTLGIWYLHVWIWEPNPSGVFADWNPAVSC